MCVFEWCAAVRAHHWETVSAFVCDVHQCFPFSKACALSLSPVSFLTAAGEVVLHQDGGGAVEFWREHFYVGHPRRQWQWAGPLPVLRHHRLGPGEWTFWRGATHADHESVNVSVFFVFVLFFKTGREEENCVPERGGKKEKKLEYKLKRTISLWVPNLPRTAIDYHHVQCQF